MVTWSSTGSTGPGMVVRGPRGAASARARAAPHGLAVLGVAHALDADRLAVAAGAAELADHGAGLEVVQALADERRTAAVGAPRRLVAQRADALAQQLTLELVLPDAQERSPHGACFAI